MKIKWNNVASFLITSARGTRIVTDPFFNRYKPYLPPPGWNSNRPGITEHADVITLSHGHFDHSYVWTIKGVPRLYTGGAPVEIKGVHFSGVVGWHDNYGRCGRGTVSIIGMNVDGIRIYHIGDYGQARITKEQRAKIGRVDILMTPWGKWGPKLLDDLNPKLVLPMHHTTVDEVKHLSGFIDLTHKTSELEYTAETLPSKRQVIMLKASLESDM